MKKRPRKAFWLSLATLALWNTPWVRAQPIPIPEIRPQMPSSPTPPQELPSEPQSPRQRWTFIAQKFREMEANADYTTGFLVSKEWRSCQCQRPDAWEVLRGLEAGEAVEVGTSAQLRCGFCLIQKYTQWQERVSQQCALMLTLSLFELERLEKSDDAKGLPRRCFERAHALSKEAGAQAGTAVGAKADVLQPRVRDILVERQEAYRYLRVIAGPQCIVSVVGTELQFGSRDWLEVPLGLTQLRLKSTCQATVEVYRGKKAEFERIEHLSPGESSFLRWERR